ncbi:hypothetical protein ACFLVQ_00295 [Chloroflexota bacterium]
MDQKQKLSKTTTIIMGAMFLIMGAVAFLVQLNVLGSTLLVAIGITGIVGAVMGKFEDKPIK